MGRKMVLTKDARDEILRLRSEVDAKGRCKWTYEEIAEKLGVSLATAYRAAAGVAGYREGKEVVLSKARLAGEAAKTARERQLAELGLDDLGIEHLLEQRQRERDCGVTGEL